MAQNPKTKQNLTKKPTINAKPKTKAQTPTTQQGTFQNIGSIDDLITGFPARLQGMGEPLPQNYATWRSIASDPTASLALAIHEQPARSANYRFLERDDAPAKARDFIEDTIRPLLSWMIHNALFSNIYGWSPMEKQFSKQNGKTVLTALKPLLVDYTKVLQDHKGRFIGLSADKGETRIAPENCLVMTRQPEANDPYGSSLASKAVKDWQSNEILRDKEMQTITKIAGLMLIIKYPMSGSAKDRNNNPVSMRDMAVRLGQQLSQGNTAIFPNEMIDGAVQAIKAGRDPKTLSTWNVDLLESSGSALSSFVDLRKHAESLIFRAFLVPEKAATEGIHGSLSMADAHANIAQQLSELLLQDVVQMINFYVINQLMALNFGMSSVGSVWVEAESLSNEQKLMRKGLLSQLLGNNNINDVRGVLDLPELMKLEDLPVGDQAFVNNVSEELNAPKPEETEEVDTEDNNDDDTIQ